MQFSTKTSAPEKTKTGCAILAVQGGKPGAAARAIDAQSGGAIAAALARGDLPTKSGATLLVGLAGPIERALLVSVGDDAAPSEKTFTEAARAALRALATTGAKDAVSWLGDVPVAGRDAGWRARAQALAARELGYRFDRMKSKRDTSPRGPGTLAFGCERAQAAAITAELKTATALADGMDLARDLGNLPGNVCTPAYLADEAKKLGREFGMKVEVLERKQMEALKMGALLAVAQGSALPPKFIVVRYEGAGAKQAPVVLVGKGITFDTGGISIKPAGEMDEMKFDMCGAASVLGTLRAVAALAPKVNLIGLIPTCENMPSGTATRPGDVVTSMSGQTIEILNTDAEGRLILCDALTYAERFKPAAVVDIATLTGACVVALGHHHSGLFTKSDALAAELTGVGRDMADPCWRMPLDDEYQDALKSNFADMGNVGGRAGGAITAACFLARYTKAYEWAHLDIAGTAWKSGAAKGSSARPVPLLTGFVLGRAG
ncbi:MAG: leucyl aminopeptidase [Burkholderiales bacterium]|nr:MAG: leucyl aminopeptidase [Burkholderiales bacterium]